MSKIIKVLNIVGGSDNGNGAGNGADNGADNNMGNDINGAVSNSNVMIVGNKNSTVNNARVDSNMNPNAPMDADSMSNNSFYQKDSVCTTTLPYHQHDPLNESTVEEMSGWSSSIADYSYHSYSTMDSVAKSACMMMCDMRFNNGDHVGTALSCKKGCEHKL